MEAFPTSWKKLWDEWDLRVAVLLSLFLQIVLIVLGNRRKYKHRIWIRIVVWSAYIAADSVATFALGVLANNIADIYKDDDAGCGDANIQLTAFWAPFLLLHLGGPDTITAYALEDNELWLRHFLGLVIQTGVAFYIFLMAWNNSYLSFLSIPMLLAGLLKYGERTWVLMSVSNDKVEDSNNLFTSKNTEFSKERTIKIYDGYYVGEEKDTEISHQIDLSILDNNSISDVDKLLIAYRLLNLTKSLLLDALLSSNEHAKIVFRNLSPRVAFDVIERQLGLAYDLLYTKAPFLHTSPGLILRVITFFLTCFVLLLFTFLNHKFNHSKVDLIITFLLLSVASGLEIYAAIVLLSSDRFVIWLSMQNKTPIKKDLTCFPLFSKTTPRWSNNMSQLSFISFCMKSTLPCHYMLKPLTFIDKNLESIWYIDYKRVSGDLKDLIYIHTKSIVGGYYEAPRIRDRGEHYPKYWEELGKSILFWHIVTEVFYNLNINDPQRTTTDVDEKFIQLTQEISRYMFYVLVLHPSMLTARMNQSGFQETVNQAVNMFATQKLTSTVEACRKLIEWQQDEGSKSSSILSVLHKAVSCAKFLKSELDNRRFYDQPLIRYSDIWKELQKNWLDILTFAAGKCRGNQHAQQLRNGGELLTHVWLLMAQFGLTDHFPSRRQITRLYAY